MEKALSDQPSTLFSAALALAIFGVLAGSVQFWDGNGAYLFPAGRYSIVCALLLALIAIFWGKTKNSKLRLEPQGFALGLLLLFVSDWLTRGYNLFQGPSIRGEVLLATLLCAFLLKRRWLHAFLFPLLLVTLVLLWHCFNSTAQGRLLTSDDHSSFILRLTLLRDNFPNIPFFYPFWNGGMDARDFFATGSLNLFFIFLPILIFAQPIVVYNFIVCSVAFLILPIATFLGARILKMRFAESALAGLLTLTSSLLLYRWGLKYGTMGFFTTAALVPLNLALAIRIISSPNDLRWPLILSSVITFTLMLFWSPSGVVFIPTIIAALITLRSLVRSLKVATLVVALLSINLPWIAVFVSVSKVAQFATIETDSKEGSAKPVEYRAKSSVPTPAELLRLFGEDKAEFFTALERISEESLKHLRESAISTNPLILFFALPGIFLFTGKERYLYLATSLWLLFLGTFVAVLKPQLELERMLVVLTLVGATPAARALSLLFEKASLPSAAKLSIVSAALCGGFVFSGPLVSGSIVKNRSLEQIHFASDALYQLAEYFRENSRGGRVLFSGFALHELDEGHLAPLSVLAKTPLMASSPFHNLWRYRQIFPPSFIGRQESGGIEEYLDLYNVSLVLAHEKQWREYFQSKPELYREEKRIGPYLIFSRTSFPNSYILKGSADEITQLENGVSFIPRSSEIVLRFNYFPFLEAKGCGITQESVAPEVKFVKLTNCYLGSKTVLRSKPARTRIGRQQ